MNRYKGAESHGLSRNKDNKMVDKPLPQDGSYRSRPQGKEDKDCMPEKLLLQNGGCFGIPCGLEDKDNREPLVTSTFLLEQKWEGKSLQSSSGG